MRLELSLIQLLVICAIMNGLIFSLLLLEKKEHRNANRFLALMVACMSFTFTPYIIDGAVWHQYHWLAWMPFSFSYWIGPAFYFYVKTLIDGKPLRKIDYWHFSPIFLNYLHSIYHALVGASNPFPYFHVGLELLESLSVLSISIYLVLVYRLISTHPQNLGTTHSNTIRDGLRWMKQLILVIATIVLLIILFLIISNGYSGKAIINDWEDFRSLILLLYGLILFGLSINGFRKSQKFNKGLFAAITPSITENKQAKLIQKLTGVMKEGQHYRNPELSLAQLSKIMGVGERSLSEAINQVLNKNYYQFINEYRVAEVKNKLKDPKYHHLTILSIALDAGFQSKTSFNRVFKSHTGLTPKAFKQKF